MQNSENGHQANTAVVYFAAPASYRASTQKYTSTKAAKNAEELINTPAASARIPRVISPRISKGKSG
ncbi:hypothetical protein Q5692_24610 [Microcoleus sp. C2C3]|uniref:hypothetical protein n=1 Tax=unclassified Microcoleus TaxID=2642155 RepID=UPI002FD0522A